MRRLSKVLSFFAAWMLVIAMLLGAVFAVAFTPAVYFFEYEKHGQAQVIGCDDATLQTITVALIDYMKGDRENLDLPVVIGLQTREAFNDKEKTHMADVRDLIDGARYAAAICLVAFAVLFSVAMFLCPAGVRGKTIASGMLWGIGGLMLLVIAIAAYFVIDFGSAWVRFHTIFFTNDLWLLDPTTDVLIMMMPQAFFVDMVSFVGVLFGAGLAILTLVLAIIRLRGDRPAVDILMEESGDALLEDGQVLPPEDEAAPQTARLEAVSAPDGDRFILPEDGETQRPPAEEIFQQFGLSDADDEPLMPDEQNPWHEEKPRKPQPIEAIPEPKTVAPPAPSVEEAATEPRQEDVAPAVAHTVKGEDNTLAVSVPVTIPASALDITRLQDGIKLELKLELFLRDGDALLGGAKAIEETSVTDDPVADEPTLSELMSRVDEIMAGLPGESSAIVTEEEAVTASQATDDADVIGHVDDILAQLPDSGEDTP